MAMYDPNQGLANSALAQLMAQSRADPQGVNMANQIWQFALDPMQANTSGYRDTYDLGIDPNALNGIQASTWLGALQQALKGGITSTDSAGSAGYGNTNRTQSYQYTPGSGAYQVGTLQDLMNKNQGLDLSQFIPSGADPLQQYLIFNDTFGRKSIDPYYVSPFNQSQLDKISSLASNLGRSVDANIANIGMIGPNTAAAGESTANVGALRGLYDNMNSLVSYGVNNPAYYNQTKQVLDDINKQLSYYNNIPGLFGDPESMGGLSFPTPANPQWGYQPGYQVQNNPASAIWKIDTTNLSGEQNPINQLQKFYSTPEYRMIFGDYAAQNPGAEPKDLFKEDPNYKFQMDEGTKNILKQQAMKGLLMSGNTAKQVQQYGQNLADSKFTDFQTKQDQLYNNYVQGLTGISNSGANAANVLSGAYMQQPQTNSAGIAQLLNSLGSGLTSIFGGQGANNAGSLMNTGAAMSGNIMSALNTAAQMQMASEAGGGGGGGGGAKAGGGKANGAMGINNGGGSF